MNKTFKDRFSYDWILYLIVVVISIASWISIFTIYHLPKDYEKIDLFFAGSVNDYSFEDDAVIALSDTSLVKVSISSIEPSNSSFNDKYDIVGLNNSDIVFVPLSIANKTACSLTFSIITNSYNQEFFTQEDNKYGIIINETIRNNLSKYFKFNNEDYVIMFNEASVNCGSITNNSFKLVEWMVSYEA